MNNTMKLEQQVTSLGLSKRLKELGVRQDSLFYWVDDEVVMKATIMFVKGDCGGPSGEPTWFDPDEVEQDNVYSAFTVAELGEMLPLWTSTFKNNDKEWSCDLSITRNNPKVAPIGDTKLTVAETEADARAKMLIWLIEEGYITQ